MKSQNKTEIVRVQKDRNYTTINNTCLRDERLSWKAKGIMAYILTLPDDWNIYLEEIMKHSPDGEKSFRTGLKELINLGYVERKQIRENNKIVGWQTIVREVPTLQQSLFADFVHVQNLHVQKEDVQNLHVQNLHVQNAGLLSTNNTNNLNILSTDNTNNLNKLNTDKELKDNVQSEIERQFEDFYKLYPRKISKSVALRSFKTQIKRHSWETILMGTKRYLDYVVALNTSIEYIKHPSTFLNQEGFLEEYELPKGGLNSSDKRNNGNQVRGKIETGPELPF